MSDECHGYVVVVNSCRSMVTFDLATTTEAEIEVVQMDEAKMIEERRKRREAIKAKYRGSATPLLVQALHINDRTGESTPRLDDEGQSTRSSAWFQSREPLVLTIISIPSINPSDTLRGRRTRVASYLCFCYDTRSFFIKKDTRKRRWSVCCGL